MKKKLLKISFAATVAVLLTSCETINIYRMRTASTKDVDNSGVFQKPLIVDLEVQPKKVEGEAMFKNQGTEYVKKMAVADALEKAGNADVLLEAQYDIERKANKVTARVKGYPAKYVNFRNLEPKDSAWIKAGKSFILNSNTIDKNLATYTETQKKSGGRLKKVVGWAAGILGFTLLFSLISSI